jgi:hypothetical protein
MLRDKGIWVGQAEWSDLRRRMSASVVQQFLRRVSRRQEIISFVRQWKVIFLISVAVYGLALLASRLFALLPGWFTLLTLALFAACTLLPAWIFYPRSKITDAARLADAKLGTHDLFLTASLIEHSLGAYRELVLKEAESRAAKAIPKKVIPFNWQRDILTLCAALAVLGVAVKVLPQCDPFGLHQQQRQLAEQRQHAREIAKATQARAALLEQKRAGEDSDVVKQAVADLEKVFQNAKPTDKNGNLARLNEQQKIFGQLWRQASEEKLKNALNVPPTSQNFGLTDPEKSEQMRNDLQKGDVSSAKREMEELKQKAQELASAKDPVEREKLQQELMDRMQSLKDTLDQQLGSQALDSDMQRALEQLALANTPELSNQSLKDMSDSLNLSEDELNQLASEMADMKNVEDALKALQMAKTLNGMQPLNGDDFGKLGDLEAYASYCEGKCDSLCDNPGDGMGPGHGYGPRPYGDDKAASDFKKEKDASMLQPGKLLMQWKTREVSDAGPAREEYLQAVQDVRQQASEAVVEEQIPPGYQAAIKKYFDTLPNGSSANGK